MNPIRVALDAEHFRQSNAGIARYASSLSAALRRIEGVSVIELGGGPLLERGTFSKRANTLRQDFFWYPWRGRRLARRAAADVYHSPLPRGPLTRGLPPFVLTLHDLAQIRFPETLTPYSRLYSQLTFHRVLSAADRIIAPSADTANDINRLLSVDAERIRVVHNGVDDIFFDTTAQAGDADTAYVLFVGTPEPRKNLARLVAAMNLVRAKHQGLELRLVGGGGWGRQTTLSTGVRVLGRVSDAQLAALYANAACVALPSIHEGFGLPVLEAMAAGAPVVTSNTGALPEIAGGAAILVDPYDVTAIADGIEAAIGDRDRLIAKGRLRAREFTWQRAARETLAVYRELA